MLPRRDRLDRQRRYNKTWRRAAAQYLREHRWCVYCAEVGRETRSQLVDHIEPVTRGGSLMNRRNWAPSCNGCHNGLIKSLEMGGFYQHWTDASGAPLPPGPTTRRAILAKASPIALRDFLSGEPQGAPTGAVA